MRKIKQSSHREFLPFILPVLLVCLSATGAHAFQQAQPGERGMVSARAVVNFLELARKEAQNPPKPERRVVPFRRMPGDRPLPPGVAIPRATEPPPDIVPKPGEPSPAPAASFEALGDNGTAIPPDTQGTVGPNHLMVALNSEVRIQNKSGGVISTVSLDLFWSTPGTAIVFDPKLAYDPFQNRYIFTVASLDLLTVASSILVGVSQTNDPTGSWNLYTVDADATDVSFADYPSLGFNKDWIVVTVNMFTVVSSAFYESKIFAFNKANLYAGSPATFTVFTDFDGFTQTPALTYDNTLATMYLAEHWHGNFMGSGFLRTSTITGPVNSPTYTAGTAFPSTPNPWRFAPPGSLDSAPQKDIADKIQNNDSRILSVVYRSGSLWAAQNAFLPANAPTRTAAQWWQFTPGGAVQQFGRVDDASGVNFYAFPSIALNAQNDVLLGYSCFSPTTFASACYSFRAAGDPPNTLRTNALMKAGEATYVKTFGGPENRWGDYSNAAVDPVNDLDMWTIQEYASSPHFPDAFDFGRWGTWWVKIPGTKKRRGQVTSQ